MKRPLAGDTNCTLFEECQKSHVKLTVSIQNLPHQHLVRPQCCTLPSVFYKANSLCSLEVFKSSVQLVIFKCKNGLLVDRKCCRDINYLLLILKYPGSNVIFTWRKRSSKKAVTVPGLLVRLHCKLEYWLCIMHYVYYTGPGCSKLD